MSRWGSTSWSRNLSDRMHIGAIAGRYANRIGSGRFILDGREYRLPLNDGRNTLHGGPGGFAYLVWQAEPGETLRLTLHSPDGDQGFPGALDAVVEYRLDGDALIIDYAATSDAPTVLNLTNHAYFNLAGSGTVLDHVLHIPSARITALNDELIPTGEIRDVAGTPLDFRTPTAIGSRIGEPNDQLHRGGYDLNYVLADAPRGAGAGRDRLGRRHCHDRAHDRARLAVLQRQLPYGRSVRVAQRALSRDSAFHRQPQPSSVSHDRAATRRTVCVAHDLSLPDRLKSGAIPFLGSKACGCRRRRGQAPRPCRRRRASRASLRRFL